MEPHSLNTRLLFALFLLTFANTNAKSSGHTSPHTKKSTHDSQSEHPSSSTEEKLNKLYEKQIQDAFNMSQITTKLEKIDEQLRNINNRLERIEQSERFNNQVYLRQTTMNNVNVEMQLESLEHKIEFSQHQMGNRLDKITSTLETILEVQGNLQKEIHIVNTFEDMFTNAVKSANENLRKEASEFARVVNKTREQLEQEIAEIILNITDSKNSTKTENTHADVVPDLSMNTLQSEMNTKYDTLLEQIENTDSTVKEILSLCNKIYETEGDKEDISNYVEILLDSITQMKKRTQEEFYNLMVRLSSGINEILAEQIDFKRNCSRLQLHEEHLEDKTVTILRHLYDLITNRTQEIHETIQRTSKEELNHCTCKINEPEHTTNKQNYSLNNIKTEAETKWSKSKLQKITSTPLQLKKSELRISNAETTNITSTKQTESQMYDASDHEETPSQITPEKVISDFPIDETV